MRVLTFLSDFGGASPYPAAMRLVAAPIAGPGVRLIDLTHEIRAQRVAEGAFVLRSLAPECPDGTVHCAVVDPGVGTARSGLVVQTERQCFVGPDNGLLIPAAERVGPIRDAFAIDLDRTAYLRTPISATFHGRDVFAPVAAHLASGVRPSAIGPQVATWQTLGVDFDGGAYHPDHRLFRAQIVYVDGFGNLVTNLATAAFDRHLPDGEELALETGGGKYRLARAPSFGFVERGELCLVGGSHGLLEISVREGSAQGRLGLDIGADLTLQRS